MRRLSRLLLLAALVAGASAFDLLDPSSVVDELSHSAGLEKWKKPDFCGCAAGRWRERQWRCAGRCGGHAPAGSAATNGPGRGAAGL